MLESLENIDKILFLLINNARASFLDKIIPYATQFPYWTPLFALIIYFLYKKFQTKIVLVLFCFALLIGISDPVANLVKKSVKRYRPTHNTEIATQVKTLNDYRGGQYGFVSSHASNSFGIAFLLLFLLKGKYRFLKVGVFVWAAFICYTRIYLGVHYPADIVGGIIIGLFAAIIAFQLFLFLEKKFYPSTQHNP